VTDWIRQRLRPAPVADDGTPLADQPVDFDGGARSNPPAPSPSMSTVLRRARHGNVAGLTDPRGRSDD